MITYIYIRGLYILIIVHIIYIFFIYLFMRYQSYKVAIDELIKKQVEQINFQ